MKPKPQLKLAAHNIVEHQSQSNSSDSTNNATNPEPTTPISQMIGFDNNRSFHFKSSPPSTPSSPISNSSLHLDSPVTPNNTLWKHEPTPLILSSPIYNEYEDPLVRFSKTNLSRTPSQRSSHNVHIQPKVSTPDLPSGLLDLPTPYQQSTASTPTSTSPLLPSIITYPRVLDISADTTNTDINLLGAGYFCKTVLSQPDPITGKVFAVKIPKNNAQGSLITHEAHILSLIFGEGNQLPGIVSFYGMVSTRFGDLTDISLSGIVMEVYQQTAQSFMSSFDPYSKQSNTMISFSDPFIGFNLWNRWAFQLIDGLLYLQSKGIVHCDIKPDNILLDQDLNAFIGDFSSAQTIEEISESTDENMSSAAFAMQFSAPELLSTPRSAKRALPSFATDTFSLGLTLLNFATGSEPYSGAVKHFTQKLLWARKGAALEACSPEDELRLTKVLPILESFLVHRKTLSEIKAQLFTL